MSKTPRKNPTDTPTASAETDEPRQLLLENLELDPKGGAFRLFQHRLLILRPEALVDLQKHLEQTIGLSSKGFLYLAGEMAAREGHGLFRPLTGREPAPRGDAEVLQRMAEAMALMGWGRFDVTSVDVETHHYLLTLQNSPVAEAYGSSKRPVCHILAGWLGGFAQGALGHNLLCEEVACRAQGRPRCEFELRPLPYP